MRSLVDVGWSLRSKTTWSQTVLGLHVSPMQQADLARKIQHTWIAEFMQCPLNADPLSRRWLNIQSALVCVGILLGCKRNKNVSSPSTCENQYCGEPPWPRGRCSASDRQGSNFESCVWRTLSSHSSHHPQEVLLAQVSLYVHKGVLKPDSFLLIFTWLYNPWVSLFVMPDFLNPYKCCYSTKSSVVVGLLIVCVSIQLY